MSLQPPYWGGLLTPHPQVRPVAQHRHPPTLGQGQALVPGPALGKRQPRNPDTDGTRLRPRSYKAAPAYQSGFLSSPRAPRASTPKCCLLGTRSRTPSFQRARGAFPTCLHPAGEGRRKAGYGKRCLRRKKGARCARPGGCSPAGREAMPGPGGAPRAARAASPPGGGARWDPPPGGSGPGPGTEAAGRRPSVLG